MNITKLAVSVLLAASFSSQAFAAKKTTIKDDCFSKRALTALKVALNQSSVENQEITIKSKTQYLLLNSRITPVRVNKLTYSKMSDVRASVFETGFTVGGESAWSSISFDIDDVSQLVKVTTDTIKGRACTLVKIERWGNDDNSFQVLDVDFVNGIE